MVIDMPDPTTSNIYVADKDESRVSVIRRAIELHNGYVVIKNEVLLVFCGGTMETGIFYVDGRFMREL